MAIITRFEPCPQCGCTGRSKPWSSGDPEPKVCARCVDDPTRRRNPIPLFLFILVLIILVVAAIFGRHE